MDTATFIRIVSEMRKAQSEYFLTRSRAALTNAKSLEKQCDAWLTAYYAQKKSDEDLQQVFNFD